MKKSLALTEIEYSIQWFLDRGASLPGYLDFYKDSHYPPKQIGEIFEADQQGHEVVLKRYRKLSGKSYGDRRHQDR